MCLANSQTIQMFDFEKLTIYLKAKEYNKKVNQFLSETNLDRTTNDQLRRDSFSIMLNIAEGIGRFTKQFWVGVKSLERIQFWVSVWSLESIKSFNYCLMHSLKPGVHPSTIQTYGLKLRMTHSEILNECIVNQLHFLLSSTLAWSKVEQKSRLWILKVSCPSYFLSSAGWSTSPTRLLPSLSKEALDQYTF